VVRESNLASVSFKLRSVEWLIRAYLQAILNGDILSSVRLRGALLLQLYVGGGSGHSPKRFPFRDIRFPPAIRPLKIYILKIS